MLNSFILLVEGLAEPTNKSETKLELSPLIAGFLLRVQSSTRQIDPMQNVHINLPFFLKLLA